MSADSFAEVLRRFRTDAGLSQEDLAEKSRLSVQGVGALERGARRAPYPETVAVLADALELDEEQRVRLQDAADRGRARGTRVAKKTAPSGPLRTLPLRPTTFVGRAEDLAAITSLLNASRLVTITGSGGIGKTRTAIEAAARLPASSAIHFVDLSSLSEPSFIIGAIATTVNVPGAGADGTIESLLALLRARRLVIILDNCEHVLADVGGIVEPILRACQDVTVLATSRERLAIGGETVYRLPSLSLPPPSVKTVDEARTFSAVELFIQRAKACDHTFQCTDGDSANVVAICRHLDGIPLAIELAAARVSTLGLVDVSKRLRNGFALISGARDLPARQQTMLATITWSYDLLTTVEQFVLQCLSVFAGGFTLQAAEGVCAGGEIVPDAVSEILSSLVDKSLVHLTISEDIARYGVLESVRAFAHDRLVASGRRDELLQRHAQWVASFADWADPARYAMSSRRVRLQIDPELENARAALTWALETPAADGAMLAGRIVTGLRMIWFYSGLLHECKRWAQAAYERIDQESNPVITALLLRTLIRTTVGDEMLTFAEHAIPIFERNGDHLGIALLHAHVSSVHRRRGLLDEAEAAMAKGSEAFERDRSPRLMPHAGFLDWRRMQHVDQGRFDDALSDINQAAAIEKAFGDEGLQWELARAEVEFARGRAARAIPIIEDVLQRAFVRQTMHRETIFLGYLLLAICRFVTDDLNAAYVAVREALLITRSPNFHQDPENALVMLALLAARRGDAALAARLLGTVEANYGHWEVDAAIIGGGYERRSRQLLSASLTHQLSRVEIASLRTEGELMPIDLAIADALKWRFE